MSQHDILLDCKRKQSEAKSFETATPFRDDGRHPRLPEHSTTNRTELDDAEISSRVGSGKPTPWDARFPLQTFQFARKPSVTYRSGVLGSLLGPYGRCHPVEFTRADECKIVLRPLLCSLRHLSRVLQQSPKSCRLMKILDTPGCM